MTTTGRQIRSATGLAFVLGVVPTQVDASELSAGISLGWIQAGTATRLAVSPHAGISWRTKSDITFHVRDLLSVVPPIQIGGAGVYNSAMVALGYGWENGDFSVGPSFAIYYMPACGSVLCGRIAGMAAGVHAQTNAYVAGPLGVSVSANVDWIGGSSLVLPGYVSILVGAGPVLRWNVK
ncbi:hypothetical protein SOCEGT47_060510 [Sorangium cellulosum]|uniref:Uncharacterized protein n=1 Tax=Sorangium cellulosum TaxID=56 RepID=A0A4P2Q7K1_SORCE|nr:hypothetical protein [Sorangium cellulosum]AUX25504.1 hypothetical protein SOCEGT47_060510 [Sorangium cellulosum]